MISIIIPAHNEEKYLPKALDCIKKQIYRDYEVIVADADSDDNTKKIAEKYGCKVVKGGLPAVGRNNGAKIAKGDLLLFMDSDIIIKDDFLKNSVMQIKNDNLDVAGCYVMPLSDKVVDKLYFMTYNIWVLLMQYFSPHASGGATFCKKWLHRKINGYDETIKFAEDMDYAKRAGKIGKFRNLNQTVYVSMRRFDSHGRLKVGMQLLFAAVHRIFAGEIRHDKLKYNLRYKK